MTPAPRRFADLFAGVVIGLAALLSLALIMHHPVLGHTPTAEATTAGIRKLAACGALLALAGTVPLVFLAQHGLVVSVLTVSLFIRGVGVSAIGIPSITSGYASVARRDLPMATTAMNIVQRIGGPTLTTLCAVFLGWRLFRLRVHFNEHGHRGESVTEHHVRDGVTRAGHHLRRARRHLETGWQFEGVPDEGGILG